MAKSRGKVIGITFSITLIMFIFLALFIKGLGVLFEDWFAANALWITIVSGSMVLIGLITGSITIGMMAAKGKGWF